MVYFHHIWISTICSLFSIYFFTELGTLHLLLPYPHPDMHDLWWSLIWSIMNNSQTRSSSELRPERDGRHLADNFKGFSWNRYMFCGNNSLKPIHKGTINKKTTTSFLCQVMVWCRTGDRPSFKPMMTKFSDAYIRHQTSISISLLSQRLHRSTFNR